MEVIPIKEWIDRLPKEIQKKLCIMTWRCFWREYVPVFAKPPSWLKYHNYVQKTLWEARQKNIHFLHLPFNTLPENKKWIMGCQCDQCINDTKVNVIEKHSYYLIQYRTHYYFIDRIMPEETQSHWNEHLVPLIRDSFQNDDHVHYIKIFDPLCGSYKED